MLGIVGERTGNKGEEVMHLGATQAPQALRTDPKCWTGLRQFVNAATKTAFTAPSSVAGVAANDSEADAFMAEHGSPLLGGKSSQYVRPFVRRKRLRGMLSALVKSSDADTASTFWKDKSVKDLSEMVPDVCDALASMPKDMPALDAAKLFQLSIVTGPLMLSMAACFWNNALGGKFGGVARYAAKHEEELRRAYETYFEQYRINASVPVLMATMATTATVPQASGPAPSRAPGRALSRAKKAKAKRSKEKVPKETVSKAKASKGKARKGKRAGTTLLNQ